MYITAYIIRKREYIHDYIYTYGWGYIHMASRTISVVDAPQRIVIVGRHDADDMSVLKVLARNGYAARHVIIAQPPSTTEERDRVIQSAIMAGQKIQATVLMFVNMYPSAHTVAVLRSSLFECVAVYLGSQFVLTKNYSALPDAASAVDVIALCEGTMQHTVLTQHYHQQQQMNKNSSLAILSLSSECPQSSAQWDRWLQRVRPHLKRRAVNEEESRISAAPTTTDGKNKHKLAPPSGAATVTRAPLPTHLITAGVRGYQDPAATILFLTMLQDYIQYAQAIHGDCGGADNVDVHVLQQVERVLTPNMDSE